MANDHAHDHAGHDHAGHSHAGHDHAGHDHGGHGHSHGGPAGPGFARRVVIAAVLLALALLAATMLTVRAGSAAVVTRFGNPVRVVIEPGLTWKMPAPIERAIDVDLRLHTTASGIHGVLTKDGLSVVVQAWVAWRVPASEAPIRGFLSAFQNRPDDAAGRLRTHLGSALETITSRFELAALLNTDPGKVQLAAYEDALRAALGQNAKDYGIEVAGVGIERLMLPETTVGATINRMAAERDTVAQAKKADGSRIAAEIRSAADKDARIAVAKASEEASAIVAAAQTEAAKIYGSAQSADPQLYAFLRSLDSLDQIVGTTTRLVLRTDAAPFRALVEIPGLTPAAPAPAAPAATAPASAKP